MIVQLQKQTLLLKIKNISMRKKQKRKKKSALQKQQGAKNGKFGE